MNSRGNSTSFYLFPLLFSQLFSLNSPVVSVVCLECLAVNSILTLHNVISLLHNLVLSVASAFGNTSKILSYFLSFVFNQTVLHLRRSEISTVGCFYVFPIQVLNIDLCPSQTGSSLSR